MASLDDCKSDRFEFCDNGDRLRFAARYTNLILAAGIPPLDAIQSLIVKMLTNAEFVNHDENLTDIAFFVRSRLRKNDVPLTWLMGEMLREIHENSIRTRIATQREIVEIFAAAVKLEGKSIDDEGTARDIKKRVAEIVLEIISKLKITCMNTKITATHREDGGWTIRLFDNEKLLASIQFTGALPRPGEFRIEQR